jgi:hypothetical protein
MSDQFRLDAFSSIIIENKACKVYPNNQLLEGTYNIVGDQLRLDFVMVVPVYTFKRIDDQLHLYKTITVFKGNPVRETRWDIHLIYQPNN